jgi:hypothetical protein
MAAMATNRFQLLTLPLAAASLALAACGGGEDPSAASGDDRARFREAALDFAECMREQGVDVPDPSPGSGGRITFAVPPGGDDAAFRRAQEACQKHLEKARPPELSEEQQREFRERALKHARCMREHGIDMPDPTFDERGGIQQRIEGDIDPSDPRFQEAQEACSRFGPRIEEGS